MCPNDGQTIRTCILRLEKVGMDKNFLGHRFQAPSRSTAEFLVNELWWSKVAASDMDVGSSDDTHYAVVGTHFQNPTNKGSYQRK